MHRRREIETNTDNRELRIAFQQYEYAIHSIPNPEQFSRPFTRRSESSAATTSTFQASDGSTAKFELAFVTNYVAMFGTNKRRQKRIIPFDQALNALKKLWRLSEESNAYSDHPDFAATFALRVVYQQLPHIIHPSRIPPMLSRMRNLMSANGMSAYSEHKYGIDARPLVPVDGVAFPAFFEGIDANI